jgi:hypothetical protein
MEARTSPPTARVASVKSPPPAQKREPVRAVPASAKFGVGDLVVCLDASKLEELGKHAGVVVNREAEKKLFTTKVVYDVRFLHRTLWRCPEKQLRRAEIAESVFPLVDLPLPALALVLFWLPDGGLQATVSSKFAAAFRDNVTWKRRCVEALKNVDVEEVFAAEKETSWMTFFFRHASYRIRIVTVFCFSQGVSLSGEFTTRCDPRMTVEAFLQKVSSHPRNRSRGLPRLSPHDPSKLGRRGQDGIVSELPDAKANCVFRQGDLKATIAEAGLVDGAVLEQPEQMMCD